MSTSIVAKRWISGLFLRAPPVNVLLISCIKMAEWIRFDLDKTKRRGVCSLLTVKNQQPENFLSFRSNNKLFIRSNPKTMPGCVKGVCEYA